VNVLVVDDDDELCMLVRVALEREGHALRTVGSLAQARLEIAQAPADVVVLDIDLPDGTGLAFCRELRGAGRSMPVLILTASGQVNARVEGLDAGADDYLVKPFAVAELRARVRALGRRAAHPSIGRLRRGDVELDFGARRVTRGGLELALTAKEWAIVEALARVHGTLVGREALLVEVWGDCSDAASASLGVLMSRIRRKLGHTIIRTVRGLGHALD